MGLLLAVLTLNMVQVAVPVALFDGKSLAGWHMDVPALDDDPDGVKPFVVRGGMLVSLGTPPGHLITDASYQDYRLVVEYRFSGEAGNCGVLVHTSTPRFLGNMLPKSLEVQMMSGNGGDFYQLGETITQRGASGENTGRRLPNFTDDSEKPVGEWNRLVIECRKDTVKVWMNGDLVNDGTGCSAVKGQIALQSEGCEVEFRKVELTKLG
ncbi:MAG: DUF1080 domain-containing protein [Armatimonadetes bacterium]|nr:DUF1080 domain-containing protein [Armatimonadota bacterium]